MVAAVTLGVLLALLAFLQYRWLGQVSEGERQRMRTTLEARARDFAADFDRELSRTAAAFAVGPGPGSRARLRGFQTVPPLVRAVFVVDRSTPALALRRFDPATRQLVPAEWPDAFRAVKERWAAEFAKAPASPPAGDRPGRRPRAPCRTCSTSPPGCSSTTSPTCRRSSCRFNRTC